MKTTRTFLLLCGLAIVRCVPVPKELDKRRESTPEILDLEKQLKKAAGEDKKYFPGANPRPVPQMDGLADATVDAVNPEAPPAEPLLPQSQGDDPGSIQEEDASYKMADNPGPLYQEQNQAVGEPPGGANENEIIFYNQLWDELKQHPDWIRRLEEINGEAPAELHAIAHEADSGGLAPSGSHPLNEESHVTEEVEQEEEEADAPNGPEVDEQIGGLNQEKAAAGEDQSVHWSPSSADDQTEALQAEMEAAANDRLRAPLTRDDLSETLSQADNEDPAVDKEGLGNGKYDEQGGGDVDGDADGNEEEQHQIANLQEQRLQEEFLKSLHQRRENMQDDFLELPDGDHLLHQVAKKGNYEGRYHGYINTPDDVTTDDETDEQPIGINTVIDGEREENSVPDQHAKRNVPLHSGMELPLM